MRGLGWSLAGVVILSAAFAVAAADHGKPQYDQKKNQAELDAAMKVIEHHLGAEKEQLGKAVEKVLGRPTESMPRLFNCFADKTKSKDSRMLCVRVLQKIGKPDSTYRASMLSIMRDRKDNPFPRIDAAAMLLEDRASLSAAEATEIKQLGFMLYREEPYKDYVAGRILNRFSNDTEVEQFFVTAAKTETDHSRRDGLLHILGKRKNKAIIGLIRTELKSNKPERLFSKARMYLALGDVGTQEAFDLLVEQLPREKNSTAHSQIRMAIGVTKNPGAKDVLVKELKKPWDMTTWSAVEGLRFLGDPGTIPILEAELTRGIPDSGYQENVRRAIDRIKAGDDKPFW